MNKELIEKAKKVKLIILDVDGVLTDGSICYGTDGNRDIEIKTFHAHDGFGISRAIRLRIPVAVITGRRSRIVQRRAKELGIKDLFQGSEDKLPAYKRLKRLYRLTDEQIAYMGDDVPDLVVLNQVGLGAAPKSAVPEVRRSIDYVSSLDGGHGAAREFIDLILRAQKKTN
jgi:3-deoxy-D-manno-octulosonate 8-phosphate phosphatase (KDO 8-P phosphatase)